MKEVKIGFLVNPVAGMGGRVGLKGTDGVIEEARKRGATPIAGERAKKALSVVPQKTKILTSSQEMGEGILNELSFGEVTVVHSFKGHSYSKDTKESCRKFLEKGVDLIVFCGGDGTARDVYSVVGDSVPILGIPAGVKMHSSVFAVSPRAAGEVLAAFLNGHTRLGDGDVMDIDEDAFRKNVPRAKLYGVARVPQLAGHLQAGKMSFAGVDETRAKRDLARFAAEFLHDDELVILGSGSTVAAVADALGVENTLLGVDVVKGGALLMKDANEKQLLKIIEKEAKIQLLVTPIGAQGFIFGRGNQQLSPAVLREVGLDNVIVLATPQKLSSFDTLRVDTGDDDLDRELSSSRQVVCGYRLAARKEVKGA